MRKFSTPFVTAKNKKASQPVNLLQIDWPGVNDLPAFRVQLSDRALAISGTDWLALVTDWGRLESGGDFSLDGELRLTLLNAPVDFGRGVERFSDILKAYPAETATVTVYQWFADEGLTAGDKAELMTARLIAPVEYDASFCSFRLVGMMEFHSRTVVGNVITATEYPKVPESSIGKIKPVVIGQVDRVPGVLVRDVSQTRLTSVAVPGGSTLDVASTENFPVVSVHLRAETGAAAVSSKPTSSTHVVRFSFMSRPLGREESQTKPPHTALSPRRGHIARKSPPSGGFPISPQNHRPSFASVARSAGNVTQNTSGISGVRIAPSKQSEPGRLVTGPARRWLGWWFTFGGDGRSLAQVRQLRRESDFSKVFLD